MFNKLFQEEETDDDDDDPAVISQFGMSPVKDIRSDEELQMDQKTHLNTPDENTKDKGEGAVMV